MTNVSNSPFPRGMKLTQTGHETHRPSDGAQYIRDNQTPPSFFPVWVDTDGLIDITGVGDTWRRYVDPTTGRIHNCADYFTQYIYALKDEL